MLENTTLKTEVLGFPLKKNKKAFALLMSLFMMGFLVLLVITLSAIVQMELKASKQTLMDQKAKQAAKLAAYQALAEVQKALGPDQRITANASILDTELNEVFDALEEDTSYSFWEMNPEFDREDVNSIEGISNPHWVGVWDSTPGIHPMPRASAYGSGDSSETRDIYTERVLLYATNFLVSGNRSIKRESISSIPDELDLGYSPVDELSADYINMLRKNSITDENGEYDSDTMQVRVPLVTLAKTSAESSRSYLETRIAWWVSDESQKAPVNVLASEDEFSIMEEDSSRKTLMQALPFKNGMQALSLPDSSSGLFDVDLGLEEDREYVRSLNEVSQLDLLMDSTNSSVSASRFLYNSVTMNTKGLAVNVRNGGLKKDLSVGLLARNSTQIDSNPNYFERPMGVEGYDAYLTNPITENGVKTVNLFEANSLYTNNKGHMFGPQAAENINLSYVGDGLSYALNQATTDDVSDLHEDPGGPLWDSLREYYNNRVDIDGYDATTNGTTGGYANKLRVKTDVTTGLSPVLLHYQLFVYPTLTSYGSSDYGVRVYFIPIVVLWNPYDVPIAEGSTYAFRHGRAHTDVIGSFRVAIGVQKNGSFDCIRDLRTETMPRLTPNSAYHSPTYGEITSYSGTDNYNTSVNINAYRAVSFSNESMGIVSATSSGINGLTAYTGVATDPQYTFADEDGTNTTESRSYEKYMKAINKSFFGYGKWTYEDTRDFVSEVEENEYFPKSDDSGRDLRSAGLVRIYNRGAVTEITRESDDATVPSETVTMPTYYYLSSDSFYYRKLYLNDLQYSLGFTFQTRMSVGGTLSDFSEDDAQESIFNSNADEAVRFLVKNESVLEPGAAKIFTLKTSVPYSYTFDGKDGYAGNFGKANETSGSDKWYLTEGVDGEGDNATIGGFFVDIMHPERTHLASERTLYSGGNTYNNSSTITPVRDATYLKNIVADPLHECKFDGKALGVLFNTNDAISYSDDDGDAEKVSISDICLDFCRWDVNPTGHTYTTYPYLTPRGYMKAEATFNPNPWHSTGSTLPYSNCGMNVQKAHKYAYDKAYPSGLYFAELLMWDYADDGDEAAEGSVAPALYLYEDGSTFAEIANNYGGRTMPFQSLKRYALVREDWCRIGTSYPGKLSFPEPWRIIEDYTSGGWCGYFSIPEGMAAFYGETFGTNVSNSDLVDIYEHPGIIEQYMFSSSTSGNINEDYSRSVGTESILDGDFSGIIRDKVRALNFPVYYKYENGTIYDEYYKNLMTEVNSRISDDSLKYEESDDGLLEFLEDLNLYDESGSVLYAYNNHSWLWEDPYFLLRNPRRIAYPRWLLKPSAGSGNANLWRDNLPGSFNVQSAQIVDADSTEALKLSAITANDGKSLVICEGISAYRPVSEELEADYESQENGEYFFQYQFKFPWLIQSNPTAKVYGDGPAGNTGAFRSLDYGTDLTRGLGSSPDGNRYFWGYGALANNFQYSSLQHGGIEDSSGNQGNLNMDKWFSFLINKYGSDQVQVGPDVLSETGYKYTLRHYLRDYEIITSPVDLATADLAFGTEQNRTLGLGTGTPDMYYPTNTIGSSFAPMRIAPERPYDYSWFDGHVDALSQRTKSGDGKRADTEIRHVTYDMSWQLNDLLWDEYFFSTVPYREGEQTDLDNYYDYLIPKNPRIKYVNLNRDRLYVRVNIDDDTTADIANNKITITNGLSTYINDSITMNQDFDMNSERFWINGPFNVNSTNVDAWKMVLGTSFGNEVYGFSDEIASTSASSYSEKAPFPRNGMPYAATEFDPAASDNSVRGAEQIVMQGFRALNREELEELALSMVENIKDRGPFYSLADFVNRSVELRSAEMRRMGTSYGNNAYDFSNDIWDDPLGSSESLKENINEDNIGDFYLRQNHMQKGVMQSAIDLTSINQAFFDDAYLVDLGEDYAAASSTVGLNSKFTTLVDKEDMSYAYLTFDRSYYNKTSTQEEFWQAFGNPRNVWENYKAVLGSTLAGAPTYLTQADILKQIGSFITVRGDTFKIRAYGEIRNPLTEEVESKAWCEMLVQRYPEYMDSTLNLATDVNNREPELGYQSSREFYDTYLEQLEPNLVNKYLGRRFKIVSFKWLSEREI